MCMRDIVEVSLWLTEFLIVIIFQVKIDGKFQDGPLKVKLVQEVFKFVSINKKCIENFWNVYKNLFGSQNHMKKWTGFDCALKTNGT